MKKLYLKRGKNKKGLSTVIETILLIALTLVAVSVVWVVVNNILNKQTHRAEACFSGSAEKISINHQYTCYNSSANEFQFSVNIEDIELKEMLIVISGNSQTKSFKITDQALIQDNIRMYNGIYNSTIRLPEKNSGLTYIINSSAIGLGKPDSLEYAPIINGEQCEPADKTSDIDECGSLS